MQCDRIVVLEWRPAVKMHGCGTTDQVHGSPRSDDVTGTRTPSQRPNRVALTLARVEVSIEHVGTE